MFIFYLLETPPHPPIPFDLVHVRTDILSDEGTSLTQCRMPSLAHKNTQRTCLRACKSDIQVHEYIQRDITVLHKLPLSLTFSLSSLSYILLKMYDNQSLFGGSKASTLSGKTGSTYRMNIPVASRGAILCEMKMQLYRRRFLCPRH